MNMVNLWNLKPITIAPIDLDAINVELMKEMKKNT